jgi:hypothetical protein
MTPDQVWPGQSPPPELGVGPEMFDWSAGWFGSFTRVLVLMLAIGLAIILMRRIAGLWRRTFPPHHKRSAQGGA